LKHTEWRDLAEMIPDTFAVFSQVTAVSRASRRLSQHLRFKNKFRFTQICFAAPPPLVLAVCVTMRNKLPCTVGKPETVGHPTTLHSHTKPTSDLAYLLQPCYVILPTVSAITSDLRDGACAPQWWSRRDRIPHFHTDIQPLQVSQGNKRG
jgi:hypothetical protein